MRDIDKKIKSLPDVIYYVRYVDDIFVLFNPTTKKEHNYFDSINEIVTDAKLELQPRTHNKTNEIDLTNMGDCIKDATFNYLGYNFFISRYNKKTYLKIRLSENKKKRYLNRIKLAIEEYNNTCHYNERIARKKLFRCFRLVMGNTILLNNKKGIKVGIYFSNSLLDKEELSDLDELQLCFENLVRQTLKPYSKLNFDMEKFKEYIINNFSFRQGFLEKRIHSFKANELKEIKQLFNNAEE